MITCSENLKGWRLRVGVCVDRIPIDQLYLLYFGDCLVYGFGSAMAVLETTDEGFFFLEGFRSTCQKS